MGLIYLPTMAVLAHHFRRKQVFVMGLVVSGGSVGGIVHPLMLNKLLFSPLGFANSVRASAGLNTGFVLLALALMRSRLPTQNTTRLIPVLKKLATDPPYLFAVLG